MSEWLVNSEIGRDVEGSGRDAYWVPSRNWTARNESNQAKA